MLGSLVRVLVSILGGGLLYTIWLAAVLAGAARPPSPVSFLVILTAPPVTAAGFGLGTLLGERLTHRPPTGLLRAWLWPLLGCAIGACAVYPFGRMLIVLGMFALGTMVVVVREVRGLRRAGAG